MLFGWTCVYGVFDGSGVKLTVASLCGLCMICLRSFYLFSRHACWVTLLALDCCFTWAEWRGPFFFCNDE